MKFLRKLISPKTLIVLDIALVLGHCIDPSIAFAAGTEAGANETLKAFAQLFSIFVNIFTFLSLIFLNYGGDLIGTEFLTAPDSMSSIRPMWVIIRNITNIGFVLVLLFLAFANLFSSLSEGSTWTIKAKLPKIILALIAINFSLLGFKVVLDAVHVGTITIFSIPDSTFRDKGVGQLKEMLMTPVETKTNSGGTETEPFYMAMNELMCGKKADWDDEDGGIKTPLPESCLFALDPSQVGVGGSRSTAAHNLFLAFGIQFNKLQALPSLAANLNDWSDVITSVLFASILSLAQVVALGAVFIALLIRVVVLWVAMVFSPLIVAASIMGFDGGKIGTQVITNLIMPIKIAAAFAITFLMMDTMINVGAPATDFIHVGASIATFGKTGYGLLWSIATVVVFWKAAFWAMDGSAATVITDKIKSGAESAGQFVAKAATIDQQILPMPGSQNGEKASLGNYFAMAGKFKSKWNTDQSNKDIEAAKGMGILDGTSAETAKSLGALSTEVKDATTAFAAIEELNASVKKNGGDILSKDPTSTKAIFDKIREKDGFTGSMETALKAIEDAIKAGKSPDEINGKIALLMQAAKVDPNAKAEDYKGTKDPKSNHEVDDTFYSNTASTPKVLISMDDDGKKHYASLTDVKAGTNEKAKLEALNAAIKDGITDGDWREDFNAEWGKIAPNLGMDAGKYEIREVTKGKDDWKMQLKSTTGADEETKDPQG